MRTFAVVVCTLAALLAGIWIYAQYGATPATRLAADVTTSSATPVRATPPAASPRQQAPRPVASPTPTPVDRCAGNRSAQLVVVSIGRQHAWLCAGARTVYQTAVTTGMNRPGDATPTGRFRIEGRNRDTVLRPDDGRAYPVKYWIPFQAPLYGFHDASWQQIPYGSSAYRTGGSHGCVHMPLKAIEFLYRWVRIGTSVVIEA